MKNLCFKKMGLYLIVIMSLGLFGCPDIIPNPVNNSDDPKSEVKVINSSEYGELITTSGEGIKTVPGTVPKNDNGEDANVSFSIETHVESPGRLKAGARFLGPLVKYGPENFNFAWPVQLSLPFSEDMNPEDLTVMYYDNIIEDWEIVPTSGIDPEKRLIFFNSINLGVFGLAQITSEYRSDDWYRGGFRFSGSRDYFYTLTVASVSDFKYPYQSNINVVGDMASTGIAFGNPLSKTYMFLPQATYKIWVTKHKAGTWTSPPGPFLTYSLPVEGTLTEPCINNDIGGSLTGYETWHPWVNLTLPGGGTWVEGLPDNWPIPTITYGTGDFQATLNWINNNDHSTDFDLHLYGPNDLHVYYHHKSSSDGSVQLDRDWLTQNGNATENIYSTGVMPSGDYKVKVKLYSGSPGSFNVRIINAGNVNTYKNSLTVVKEEVLIEEFTIQ